MSVYPLLYSIYDDASDFIFFLTSGGVGVPLQHSEAVVAETNKQLTTAKKNILSTVQEDDERDAYERVISKSCKGSKKPEAEVLNC